MIEREGSEPPRVQPDLLGPRSSDPPDADAQCYYHKIELFHWWPQVGQVCQVHFCLIISKQWNNLSLLEIEKGPKMKYTTQGFATYRIPFLAVVATVGTLMLAQPSHAAACANGVYRAGCVGPNGAAVVRKP